MLPSKIVTVPCCVLVALVTVLVLLSVNVKPTTSDSPQHNATPSNISHSEEMKSNLAHTPALRPRRRHRVISDDEHFPCRALDVFERANMILPSDIHEIVQLLYSYYLEDGMDVVVEAGARTGCSTAMLLRAARRRADPTSVVSIELEVHPDLRALFECAKRCDALKNRAGNATNQSLAPSKPDDDDEAHAFHLIHGNDLMVQLPVPLMDSLLLDTIHNGDQLLMELRRFPKNVRRLLFFHDVVTFRFNDESSELTAHGFPPEEGMARPVGLEAPIRDFLRRSNGSWLEEMFYAHNNGLLVLRRRALEPHCSFRPKPELIGFPVENVAAVKNLANMFVAMSWQGIENLAAQCHAACVDVGKAAELPMSRCCTMAYDKRPTKVIHVFNDMLTDETNLMSSLMPVIYGHLLAFRELKRSPLGASDDGTRRRAQMLYWGAHASAFVAYFHAVFEGQLKQGFLEDPPNSAASKAIRWYNPQRLDLPAVLTSETLFDGVLISAEILSQQTEATLDTLLRKTNIRLHVYGTSVTNVEPQLKFILSTKLFVLRSCFRAGAGFMMFHRVGNKQLFFLPEFAP